MNVRNCGELGINLQKIVGRLLANDNLVKLLYYENQDPLGSTNLTTKEKQELIYEKLIKVTPRVTEDDKDKTVLVVYVSKGTKNEYNSEFVVINFIVDIFVPLDKWKIKDTNLRPFAILGEVQNALEGKTINGLGQISGGDFELTNLSEKTSVYSQVFSITQYD